MQLGAAVCRGPAPFCVEASSGPRRVSGLALLLLRDDFSAVLLPERRKKIPRLPRRKKTDWGLRAHARSPGRVHSSQSTALVAQRRRRREERRGVDLLQLVVFAPEKIQGEKIPAAFAVVKISAIEWWCGPYYSGERRARTTRAAFWETTTGSRALLSWTGGNRRVCFLVQLEREKSTSVCRVVCVLVVLLRPA